MSTRLPPARPAEPARRHDVAGSRPDRSHRRTVVRLGHCRHAQQSIGRAPARRVRHRKGSNPASWRLAAVWRRDDVARRSSITSPGARGHPMRQQLHRQVSPSRRKRTGAAQESLRDRVSVAGSGPTRTPQNPKHRWATTCRRAANNPYQNKNLRRERHDEQPVTGSQGLGADTRSRGHSQTDIHNLVHPPFAGRALWAPARSGAVSAAACISAAGPDTHRRAERRNASPNALPCRRPDLPRESRGSGSRPDARAMTQPAGEPPVGD